MLYGLPESSVSKLCEKNAQLWCFSLLLKPDVVLSLYRIYVIGKTRMSQIIDCVHIFGLKYSIILWFRRMLISHIGVFYLLNAHFSFDKNPCEWSAMAWKRTAFNVIQCRSWFENEGKLIFCALLLPGPGVCFQMFPGSRSAQKIIYPSFSNHERHWTTSKAVRFQAIADHSQGFLS